MIPHLLPPTFVRCRLSIPSTYDNHRKVKSKNQAPVKKKKKKQPGGEVGKEIGLESRLLLDRLFKIIVPLLNFVRA